MNLPLGRLKTVLAVAGLVVTVLVAAASAVEWWRRLTSRTADLVPRERLIADFVSGETHLVVTAGLILLTILRLRGTWQSIALLALGCHLTIAGVFASLALSREGIWLFWAGLPLIAAGVLASIGTARPYLSIIAGAIGAIVYWLAWSAFGALWWR